MAETKKKSSRSKKKKQNRLRITLVKSTIGYSQRQKDTVRSLGLRRINHSVEHNDTDVIRGMIAKVSHLIEVEEMGG